MDVKKVINNLKNIFKKKNVGNLIILFLVGVLLIIIGSTFKKPVKPTMANKNDLEVEKDKNDDLSIKKNGKYEESLKEELKNSLNKVKGVGKVEVMIYFESGEEHVPAFNNTDSTSNSQETDNEGGKRNVTQKNSGQTVVITNDGNKSEPFILKTVKPKVTGVFIVAEGAEDKMVEYKICKAVTDLFNIPQNKVNVYPMKK